MEVVEFAKNVAKRQFATKSSPTAVVVAFLRKHLGNLVRVY